MGGIGIWQLIIVAVIIILLFGTKKLRNLGSDLGSAVKGFKKAVTDEDKAAQDAEAKVIEENTATSQENVQAKEKDNA